MSEKDKDAFLWLVRAGIRHASEDFPDAIDWKRMRALADEQGLSAIVLDGAETLWHASGSQSARLPSDVGWIDPMLKKQWIGTVILSYEHKYEDYRIRIGQLASFYNTHGFKLMVLKGYGLSLNYPKPSHRPVGDIDIWAFGRYKEVDAALSRELSIPINNSHHHHTVFNFMGYMVENHFDWVNVHAHRSSAEIEKVFKKLAMDDSYWIEIDSQRVYLPCPNLHALFLLRHTMSHFASTSMSLRQLLDWAFFVEKNTECIDWDWLQKTLKHFHMFDFFVCLNYICAFQFGFDVRIFPPIVLPVAEGNNLQSLPERILNDMLSPEYSAAAPNGFIRRMKYKYKRWQANAWKQRLCYPESRFSSFFTGLWAHILKPSSL